MSPLRIGLAGTVRSHRDASLSLASGEGIGTFATHLVGGLVASPDADVEVVVTTLAGDEARVRPELPLDGRVSLRVVAPRADGTFEPPAPCDVWVLPSLHSHRPTGGGPTVVFVHDLVAEHLPELFDPTFRAATRVQARDAAASATFVACMSATTRDLDLYGVLGLAPERVRLVPTAWPTDLPVLGEEEVDVLVPASITAPYVLFPAQFRPSKNHRVLLDALWRIRDYYGVRDLHLVVTGGEPGALPDDLADLVRERALAGWVHSLGVVPRPVLAALYRRAIATVVPSLHEQGSYPLAEALSVGCPIAASDIAAFREQCGPLGTAMRYFDPRDAHAVARCILDIRERRAEVLAAQAAVAPGMLDRSWAQVGAAWSAVFAEAAASATTSRKTSAY